MEDEMVISPSEPPVRVDEDARPKRRTDSGKRLEKRLRLLLDRTLHGDPNAPRLMEDAALRPLVRNLRAAFPMELDSAILSDSVREALHAILKNPSMFDPRTKELTRLLLLLAGRNAIERIRRGWASGPTKRTESNRGSAHLGLALTGGALLSVGVLLVGFLASSRGSSPAGFPDPEPILRTTTEEPPDIRHRASREYPPQNPSSDEFVPDDTPEDKLRKFRALNELREYRRQKPLSYRDFELQYDAPAEETTGR
jgi:hypothetical protein